MEHAEQVRLTRLLMDHLDNDTNVDTGCHVENPASSYTSPELAAREWERFFRGHAQIVGMSGDLAGPGSFLTLDDFGIPILAVRDAEGRFRAFVNSCRHRGTMLEQERRGERTRFACPFHAWVYSNEGELVGMPKPHHFGNVDRSCLGLLALPAEEKHGFLWVHPDPEGTLDPEALLSGLGPEFASWDFGTLAYVGEETYDMRLNWKLAMDTFGETYHFKALHKNSLALTFYGNAQGYDTFGRNHRMALCQKSIDTLRGLPESEWDITVAAFPVYYLFPNVQVNCGGAGVVLVRAYPVPGDPGRSVSRISYYAKPEVLAENPDEVRLRFKLFADVVRDEDYATAETAQRALESGLQKSVLFGCNEPALHHYHATYREALGMPPLEPRKPASPAVERD